MNDDLTLFSRPILHPRDDRAVEDVHGLARFGDPDTSQAAASKITGRTERDILAVYRAKFEAYPSLGRDHGFTDDELVAWLPTVYPPTVKSARSRLSKQGLLIDSGARRPSNRGVSQIVWRLRP